MLELFLILLMITGIVVFALQPADKTVAKAAIPVTVTSTAPQAITAVAAKLKENLQMTNPAKKP